MEQRITFDCKGLELEGLWTAGSSTSASIITHPHPLYGGDMHNAVVAAIAMAYHNKGWSTLRFNFRGTGGSGGRLDNGNGEQNDIDAAVDYLATEGVQEIELTGYSFGAWVLACRAQGNGGQDHPLRFVAPPVGFMDFSAIGRLQPLRQVIVGTDDAFAPLNQVKSLLLYWNPAADLHVIQTADHFFGNHMDALQKTIETALAAK